MGEKKTAEEGSQPDAAVYEPAREALYYLIGRRLLDGAKPGDLAERLGVEPSVIEEGWRVSQEQLSLDLAVTRSTEFRLLTMTELQQESLHCVRRLLEWRERLLLRTLPDA